MEGRTVNKLNLMKSIIPRLAIPVLAALALVGCNKNSPSNSTETPSPNSSMNHANGMMGGTTNMPASTKTTGAANDATR
jgi:outer membrane PBP1 activator LpoA protein